MTTTCALCRLALWRADIFSANKRPQKEMRERALKGFSGCVAYWSFTVRILVFSLPHFMHISTVWLLCVREKHSVSICVCLCLMILLPFIGGCGVCGKMSVAHFHTPIVSQWVCRCGGYSSWSPFHHITDKRRCWAVEKDCCVWGETEWEHMWFAPLIFYERIQQGIVFALS